MILRKALLGNPYVFLFWTFSSRFFFRNRIGKAAADEKIPVLLVDKINTMRQHREEIFGLDLGSEERK